MSADSRKSLSDEDDDEHPRLSASALEACRSFFAERAAKQCRSLTKDYPYGELDEIWQLSQFWYDEETAAVLAAEALHAAGPNGRIACISCPTAYRKILRLKPDNVTVRLLEYDERFRVFGEDFVFYDYNRPLALDPGLALAFDVVLADPPFLSDECLEKTAATIKFLTRSKVVLCTGAVMEERAAELLGLSRSGFKPRHARSLGNDFCCFKNFDFEEDLR